MEKETLRIACVGYFQGYAGAEKSLICLANALNEKKYRISVINIGNGKIVYPINKEIEVIDIRIRKKIERFVEFRKIIKKGRYDIVINYWAQSAIFSAMFCKKHNIKTIYSERGNPDDKEYTGILGVLRKIYFKKIDGFVFQTQAARDCFPEDIRRKSTVIQNPIFINKSDYKMPLVRKEKIVTVGRLHEQKNQKFLLEVFKDFLKTHKNYILEIYGEGPLKEILEEYSKKLGINKNVNFMGNKEDIYSYIINAKMFVLTSKYEGMPNVILEAMALGIPTICSNYNPKDAVYEIIEDGVNGFVYEQNDRIKLISIMDEITKNEKIVEKISNNAKNICETHSKENIYNKWEKFINDMCEN